MKLAEKLRLLRRQEGNARGLDRPLTQSEVARMLKKETGKGLTQAYLSQLESGKRRHLTADTRSQLSNFFGVHPGYLVDDPETLVHGRSSKNPLNQWLMEGAERFETLDPPFAQLLRSLAADRKAKRYFEFIEALRKQKGGLAKFLKDSGVAV